MSGIAMKIRKWIAFGMLLATMLAVGIASGKDYGACYEAYRSSGLTQQQVSFDEFHKLYADTLCAQDSLYQGNDSVGEAASRTLPGKD